MGVETEEMPLPVRVEVGSRLRSDRGGISDRVAAEEAAVEAVGGRLAREEEVVVTVIVDVVVVGDMAAGGKYSV